LKSLIRQSFTPPEFCTIRYILYNKNLAVKMFGKKAAAKDWQKTWQMLTYIANHRLTVKQSNAKH